MVGSIVTAIHLKVLTVKLGAVAAGAMINWPVTLTCIIVGSAIFIISKLGWIYLEREKGKNGEERKESDAKMDGWVENAEMNAIPPEFNNNPNVEVRQGNENFTHGFVQNQRSNGHNAGTRGYVNANSTVVNPNPKKKHWNVFYWFTKKPTPKIQQIMQRTL